MDQYINDSYTSELSELYGKVGLIVNLSQMLEYALANIFAFNELLKEFEGKDSMPVLEYNEFAKEANNWYKKLNSHTLGYEIKEAQKTKIFKDDFIKELNRVCKERNDVIHNLFKNDLLNNKYLETNPKIYFERLGNLIVDMNEINNFLNEIFRLQKEEYKLIW